MGKYADARVVVFQEDYKSKKGKVLYAKGSTHVIKAQLLERIEERGAKVKVQNVDFKKKEASLKAKMEVSRKAA